MKPHLPKTLRAALVAAMLSTTSVATAGIVYDVPDIGDVTMDEVQNTLEIANLPSFEHCSSGRFAYFHNDGYPVIRLLNIGDINFSNNAVYDRNGDLDEGAVVYGDEMTLIIDTADNVTFSGNRAKSGSIILDEVSGAGDGSNFIARNVSGTILFDSNEGGLFRRTNFSVADSGALVFSNNKSALIYGDANGGPTVSVSGVKTVSFTDNGSTSSTLFSYCRNISFSDCGTVTFANNSSGNAMFGTNGIQFTNIGDLSFKGNKLQSTIFSDINVAIKGVSGTFTLSGNTATGGGYRGMLFSSNRTFTLEGGRYSAETDTYAGKGELVDISGNSISGVNYDTPFSTSSLNVRNFGTLQVKGNEFDNTEGSRSTGLYYCVAGELNTQNVSKIEIKGNTADCKTTAGRIAETAVVEGVDSFTVSGNVFHSSGSGATAYFNSLTLAGASESATASICDNSVTAGTSVGAASTSQKQNLSRLALFEYSRNTVQGSGNVGGMFGEPVFDNVQKAVFRNNTVRTGDASSNRNVALGAVYSVRVSGSTLSGVPYLEFSGNKAEGTTDAETNPHGFAYSVTGAVIWLKSDLSIKDIDSLVVKNNIARGAKESVGGFTSGTLTLSGNASVTMSGNKAESRADGNAAGGVHNGSCNIFKNGVVTMSGNSAESLLTQDGISADGSASGGAISGSNIVIEDNNQVRITGNHAAATSIGNALGGGIRAGKSLDINEKDFVSRGNYISDGSTVRLNGICAYSNGVAVPAKISAQGAAGMVAIYDGMYANGIVTFNGAEGATGTVVLSGKYAEADLKALNPKYTQADLEASLTTSGRQFYINKGTVEVCDGAILKSETTYTPNLEVGASAKLSMRDGSIVLGKRGDIYGKMSFKGHNTLTASSIILKDKSQLHFTITSTTAPALMDLTGSLSQSGALTIDISGIPGLSAGRYKLISTTSAFSTSNWTAGNVSVTSRIGVKFSDLVWDGNTLYYVCATPPETVLVWNNATKDGKWSTSSANWIYDGEQYSKTSTSSVQFNDTGAGTVTLVGDQSAVKVTVNNSSGKNYTFSGSGRITGASSLIKSGAGMLTINTANTYTGGTTLKGGVLVAKNVKAFGTGGVTVTGGTLHMGSLALTNTVNVNATSAVINCASAYRGNLYLTKGTLTGQNINLYTGKTATLRAGSIKNNLVGAGKVVKDTTGTVYVYGTNTYTGGTTIKAGTLVAKNVKAFGTGGVTMTGGTLHMGSYALTNTVNVNGTTAVINGGTAYRGNLTLTKGTLSGQNINLYTGTTATLKTGTVKNVLAGAGKVVKDTTGTAYLFGANTYKGGTTVQAGILSAKNVKALGTGAVTMTGGSLYLNSLAVANEVNVNATSAIVKGSTAYKGKLTLTKGTLSGDKINLTSGKNAYLKTGTVKNALGGTGHVYKQGTGTVTLAGTNNWTGNTYVQGGTLVISGATTLRGTTRTYANSKLDIRRAVTMGNLYLGGGTLALKAGNMLTVTGTLTLANATKLALSGVTASSPVLIKYGKLSNTSKKSLNQFFGLTSAYTVTNKGGKLTIAKAGSKKGTAEFELEEAYTATPNTLGQATWGTARAARLFDHTVRDHAQAQSVALDKNRSVWFAGMSGFSHVDDAADTNIYGGAVGMQFNGSMGGNAGIAIGQTFGHVSPAGATRVKQQTQHAALYGTKMLYTSATDSVSLTGTASYGTTDSDHETLDWTQHSAVLGVRGTWEHKVGKSTGIYGFAGLEYLATDSESGSGSIQALQGSIGAGISHTEGRLTLHADASFTPDMVRNAPSSTVNPGRLGFEVGAGASYRISDKWSINAGYTYHNEKRSDSHEAYIGARCTF